MKLLVKFKSKCKIVLIFLSSITMLTTACKEDTETNLDYTEEMRQFVIAISEYAKTVIPDFIVIPQNGQELITENGETDGKIKNDYLNAIDGTGREDLFFGYQKDDRATPENEQKYMIGFCNFFVNKGKTVLVTDYCNSVSNINESYSQNYKLNYISFASCERNLTVIPNYPTLPFHQNNNNILLLSNAKNFLYLINSENYASKADFILALNKTNYDVLIIDLFHNELLFTSEEIKQLKTKHEGGKRLVICYMSIGEAEDYRFYWNEGWNKNSPDWLAKENPNWKGNFKVRYWDKDWQNIILGSPNSYLDKIIEAQFDGVYLDIIDAFEYFENA